MTFDQKFQAIKRERDELQRLIDRGKGAWPELNYIKDDIWQHWLGQLQGLNLALDILEGKQT